MTKALIAGLVLFATAPCAHAAQQPDIGKTAAVQRQVSGKQDDKSRRLKKGDTVYLNETIETGAKAHGEFIFKDDTKLAVGANSRIVLDTFVYNPEKSGSEIIINATKGAFRFISGKSGSAAYKIKTPSASIGVRGTIFDGYVTDTGEIAILLVKGEVDICGRATACRRLSRVGHFVHVSAAGLVSKVLKWDGTFFAGVDFAAAFPFVGRKLIIDPVRRLKRASLYGGRLLNRGLRDPARAIRRSVPTPRLPRPRLPF